MAFARGAARIEVEQLGRGVAHLFGGLALGLVPLARAELVQRGFGRIDAGVAADQVQMRHRHVQRGVVGVAEVQELAGAFAAEVEVDQSAVAPDAVVGVHHRIADLQLGQVLDQRLDVAHRLLAAAPTQGRRGGEEFRLGDERDRRRVVAFPHEAARERRGRNRDRFVAAFELGQRRHARHVDAVVAQQLEQALAPAFAFGDQQHAGGLRVDQAAERCQRLLRTALHADVGRRCVPTHGRQRRRRPSAGAAPEWHAPR